MREPAVIETPLLRPLLGEDEDRPMPLFEHLAELRQRLINVLLILAGGSLIVFHYSGDALAWLARPVGELVFVAPTEAFYTRCRVAIFGGFALTLPLLLHQAWLFSARAIGRRWRAMILRLLPISYALFLLGAAISLFIVVPAAMKFLLSYGGVGLKPMITLASYLDFVTGLTLAFGGVFQLPLVLYGLNRMGLVRKATVKTYRRQVWFLCFVAAAFLTPGPDPLSQISLAVPAVVLFELTLVAMA